MYETRAHEVTFPAFKENLLDRLGADLALCVGDGPREKPNPFYDEAKYVWKFQETRLGGEDWSVAMDEFAQGKSWRCLLELPDSWIGGIKDPVHSWPGFGHMFLIFREFLSRSIEAAGVIDQYDWLILTRSDMMYPIPHPRLDLFSPDHVWVPDAERYNGFTDRHMFVPKRHFKAFLKLTHDVFANPQQLLSRMKALNRAWNVESFIKFRYHELGLLEQVRFFPYFMYLVRAPDGATRWSLGDYSAQHRFYIKYRKEYFSSLFVQALVTEDGDWRHLIGWQRFFNWRMYAYALMRTAAERYEMPERYRSLRMMKRFLVLMLQPVETGKLDRLR
jgi:hypothetical protein